MYYGLVGGVCETKKKALEAKEQPTNGPAQEKIMKKRLPFPRFRRPRCELVSKALPLRSAALIILSLQ